jgi:hypothetical protein
MNTAAGLINSNTSNTVQNVKQTNKNLLYNPVIPIKGDKNLSSGVKKNRELKFKDRFYQDMLVGSVVKNGTGFSLGQNDKGLDYDRSIDTNMLRRRNKENTKYYQPDDFYNGSYSAYYELPTTIKTPRLAPKTMVNNIPTSMPLNKSLDNKLDYRNRFKTDEPTLGLPTPVAPKYKDIVPQTGDNNNYDQMPLIPNMYPGDLKLRKNNYEFIGQRQNETSNKYTPIGSDPTDDAEYLKKMKQIESDRQQSLLDREQYRNTKAPSWFNSDYKDKYGKPVIRSGTRTPAKHIKGADKLFRDHPL